MASKELHDCVSPLCNLLNEESLFSDDEDSEGDNADEDEGAKYNDHDNTKSDALLDIDQISSFQFSQEPFDIILEEAQEKVRLDVLPEKILDKSYLNRDEARPHTWKRTDQFLTYDARRIRIVSHNASDKVILPRLFQIWRHFEIPPL